MDEINISYVYAILNVSTKRTYIGSTTNFSSRKRQHRSDLKKQKHPSKLMQDDYNQYGEDTFQFFILENVKTFSRDELFSREQAWMDLYHPEYNVNKLAGNWFHESAYTPEAKQKHREKITGRKQSQEEKDKRAKSIREFWARPENKGKKVVSQAQRRVLSEKNSGENNPNWGKHRNIVSKEKARDSLSKFVYVFLSPGEEEFYIRRGLIQCTDEGLPIPYWAARKLYIGNKKEYKGWKFLRTEPK